MAALGVCGLRAWHRHRRLGLLWALRSPPPPPCWAAVGSAPVAVAVVPGMGGPCARRRHCRFRDTRARPSSRGALRFGPRPVAAYAPKTAVAVPGAKS